MPQKNEEEDGKQKIMVAFTDFQLIPLGFEDLNKAKLNENLTIKLSGRNAAVTDTIGLDCSVQYDFSTDLRSCFTSRAIALVPGGWLPPALSVGHQNPILLIDRNIVSLIVSRFRNRNDVKERPDFLDLFADQHVRINPLLYIIEGNTKSIPTPENIKVQLDEVIIKVRKALPKATIISDEAHFRGVLGMIDDSREMMKRKNNFLCSISEFLNSPVAGRDIEEYWMKVIYTANSCQIPYDSLVVIAALSTVSVPNGRSPARRLLKFKRGYSDEDAYNALCDIQVIEIFISFLCLFPDEPVQLCTGDKDLALFWCGIQATNFQRMGSNPSFVLQLGESLFPKVSQELWKKLEA